jgi:hypothetical protein
MMHLTRPSAIALITSLATLGLCAFQFGDRNGFNSMPFSRVQALAPNLAEAQRMAKQGNIEILAEQAVPGAVVTLRRELSDANCYPTKHEHDYDHALCAKLYVAAGSPLLFIPDRDEKIYLVLLARNAVRIPEAILNQIGVPGIVVNGNAISKNGIEALAIASVEH